MPSSSRKRNKGQERKAKAKEAAAAAHIYAGSKECSHMEINPTGKSDDKLCSDFLLTFFRSMVSNKTHTTSAAAMLALNIAYRKFPEAVNEYNLNQVKKNILSNGVNDLLRGETSRQFARGCAAALMAIDSYSPLSDVPLCRLDERDAKVLMRNMDIMNGCYHSLVKFYVNRIPCNCLDDLYAKIRSTTPKMGVCPNCKHTKERNSMFTCTGCERVQYCSKTCQLEHVPLHKENCKIWQSGKFTYS
jgi:hypothetical protein